MVFIAGGAAIVTQAIADKFTYGQYGSDNTLESYNDTGLGTAIPASQKTVTNTVAAGSIITVHDLLSTEANGSDLREFELSEGISTPLTRKTTTTLTKESNKEVTTTTVTYIDFN